MKMMTKKLTSFGMAVLLALTMLLPDIYLNTIPVYADDEFTITLSTTTLTYKGVAQTPDVSVTYGGNTLTLGTDYSLTYYSLGSDGSTWSATTADSIVNVGTYKVVATGLSTSASYASYNGSEQFTIAQVKFGSGLSSVTLDTTSYTYDGSEKTPEVTVTAYVNGSNTELTKGTDYTVAYTDNTDAGTATVTVTGVNNFTGTMNETFTISKRALSSFDITADTCVYTGSEVSPNYTFTLNGSSYSLTEGTDFTVKYYKANTDDLSNATETALSGNPTDVGFYRAYLTGKGNYSGSLATGVNFYVAYDASENAENYIQVASNPTSYIYSGTSCIPTMLISYSGLEITDSQDSTFDGSGSGILVKGTDYTVTYSNYTNVGTATATITFKRYFTGTVNYGYNIYADKLSDCTVTLDSDTLTYTGSTCAPTVTVEDSSGNTLTEGSDFTVSYLDGDGLEVDPIAVGTYTVVVTGAGNYTGTNNAQSYTIVAKDISSSTAEVDEDACGYDGTNNVEPTITVKDGSTTLTLGTDYTITYGTNKTIGNNTGTATITGKGNYTGTLAVTFDVLADISSVATVELYTDSTMSTPVEDDTYTYTGAAQTPYILVYIDVDGDGAYDSSADTLLTENTHYTVTYSKSGKTVSSPTDAGTYTIKVAGYDYYSGSISKTYTIQSIDIADATVAEISDQTYIAAYIMPEVTVSYDLDGDGSLDTLTKGTHYTMTYSGHRNAGTATITLTGKGSFTGTKTVNFTVNAAVLGTDVTNLSTSAGGCYYSGEPAEPVVTVTGTLNGSSVTLTQGTDFTLTYYADANCTEEIAASNVIEVGTYYYTINGKGNYQGTYPTDGTALSFEVKYDFSKCTVVLQSTNYDYTGSAVKPNVQQVYYESDTGIESLNAGEDYSTTYEYTNNVDAGTGTVKVTGSGDWDGTAKATFTINAINLTGATVTLAATSYVYSGNAIKPTVSSVVIGSTTLAENTDYSVNYEDSPTDVGIHYVTISGTGNYTGSVTSAYSITRKSISGYSPSLSQVSYNYSGEVCAPTVEISGLEEGTDFSYAYYSDSSYNTQVTKPINIGTYYVKVTGLGNYSGTCPSTASDLSFKIEKKSVASMDLTLSEYYYDYDGTNKTPTPTLVYSYTNSAGTTVSRTLTAGTDYSIAYEDNVSVGKATITLTGMGNYKGTISENFYVQQNISGFTMTITDSCTYNTAAQEPTVTISGIIDGTSNEVTLEEDTDYKLTYTNNINVGTATVLATATGTTYSGSCSTTFEIAQDDVANATVSIASGTYTYNGSAIEPDVTVTRSYTIGGTTQTVTLAEGTDYTLEYGNNVKASAYSGATATVTITGINNYTGTNTDATFEIAQASVTDASVALQYNTTVFNGSSKEPTVTVSLDGNTLVKDTDYTVTYTNNTNVGTATVTIVGANNYTDTQAKTFTITALSISEADVVLTDENAGVSYNSSTGYYTAVYTGSEIQPVPAVSVDLDGDGTMEEDELLTEGTDYTVSYQDNLDKGTAQVVITGTGNYIGTATKQFVITQKSIAGLIITLIPSTFYYSGSALEPSVVATLDDRTLSQTSDYDVEYSNNVNVGTANVKITGKGNYTGTVTSTFSIEILDLTNTDRNALQITEETEYVYTGSVIRPVYAISGYYTLNSGDTVDVNLTQDVDFTATYYTDSAMTTAATVKDAGTYYVKLTGDGTNVTHALTTSLTVSPADINNATFIQSDSTLTYTGSENVPTFTFKFNGTTLTEGTDYDVTYYSDSAYTTQVDSPVEVGDYYVAFAGKGNFDETYYSSFSITEKSITASDITATLYASGTDVTNKEEAYEYDGEIHVPSLLVTDETRDTELTLGTDFTVAYYTDKDCTETATAFVNSGIYYIKITGKGNYTDSRVVYYGIMQHTVEDATVTIEPTSNEYAGSGAAEQYPTITVEMGDTTLTADVDYTLGFYTNSLCTTEAESIKDADVYFVKVTGIGNYSGTMTLDSSGNTLTYEITTLDIASDTLTLGVDWESKTYSGGVQVPDITITGTNADGTTVSLLEGTDYEITFYTSAARSQSYAIDETEIVDSGTYYYRVTGTNSCTGTLTGSFAIEPVDISSGYEIECETLTYTGSAQTPKIILVNASDDSETISDGYTLTYYSDAAYTTTTTVVNAGTYYVKVEGTGTNVSGSFYSSFEMGKANLSETTISASDQKYTGSAVTPELTVLFNGITLTKDTDYTATFSNNIYVGTAKITITASSTSTNFTGSNTGTFRIGYDLTDAQVSVEDTEYTYDGETHIPTITVRMDLDGDDEYETEVNASNYTVTILNSEGAQTEAPTDADTYTISAAGNDDTEYINAVTATYVINPASITGYTMSLSSTSYSYTGSAFRPTVTVEGLTENTDFSVTYRDNISVGTATVVVTGINNYTGTKYLYFTILQGDSETQITITPVVTSVVSVTVERYVAEGKTVSRNGVNYKVTGENTVVVDSAASKTKGKITIPSKVSISGRNFKVVSVSSGAFKNNDNITYVTIKSTYLTEIGKQAFAGCDNLKSVTISSKKLKTIGAKAFQGDKKLSSITLKSANLTKVGKDAFKGIASKASVVLAKKTYSKTKALLQKTKGTPKSLVYKRS